jgi:hypothetical protein
MTNFFEKNSEKLDVIRYAISYTLIGLGMAMFASVNLQMGVGSVLLLLSYGIFKQNLSKGISWSIGVVGISLLAHVPYNPVSEQIAGVFLTLFAMLLGAFAPIEWGGSK